MALPLSFLSRLSRATCAQLAICRSSASGCPSRPALANCKQSGLKRMVEELRHIPDFPLIYPDFLQSPVWNRRNPLKEELELQDMLERRMHVDIPEFFVGQFFFLLGILYSKILKT
ncbi:hypothetical protein OESDEN_02521, partial [Oesophagostomum dentatum]